MIVKFSGHSDDIVLVTDASGQDEFGVYDQTPALFYVEDEDDNTMAVVAHYNGTWSFAPGLYEEDEVLPEWPVSIGPEHPYSVELRIEAPEGTTVRRADGDDSDG